jgi:hypothetical protein
MRTDISGQKISKIQLVPATTKPGSVERAQHYMLNFFTANGIDSLTGKPSHKILQSFSYSNEDAMTAIAKEYGVDKFGEDGCWYPPGAEQPKKVKTAK